MEIRPVTADELPAWLRTAEGAFHEDVAPEDIEMDRALVEPERTLAVFDGPDIVATSAVLTRELTIPVTVMRVAAVTGVGVLATHRRRGMLTALMRRPIDDVRAAGESVAVLWASEPVIYGRFGYGLAAAHASVTLRTAGARLHPELPAPDGRMTLLEPSAAVERIAPFYDRVRRKRVGHLDRTPPWWTRRVWDPERHRDGRSALRAAVHENPAGEVDGYALYAVKSDWSDGPNATAYVREYVADGPVATAAVWGYLIGLDLTRTVECWIDAPDTPFADLIQGPQRTRMDLGQNLWIRLVDLPAALAARTYGAAFDVVLEVEDAFCPWNAGRYRLAADAPGARATCERTDAPPDSRCRRPTSAPRTSAGRASRRGRRSDAFASSAPGRSSRSRSRSGPYGRPTAPRSSESPACRAGATGTRRRRPSGTELRARHDHPATVTGGAADSRRPRVARADDRGRLVRPLRRHDRDEPAAHVEDVPHLRVGDRAKPGDEVEHGRHRQRCLDRVPHAPAAEAQEVAHAAAGDVGEAVDGDVRAQEVEHRAHVDDGRLEQRVGHTAPAEAVRAIGKREAALVEQRPARERVAVGVQAARGQAEQGVARRDVVAGDDRVERDRADRGAAEVEAVRRRMAADQLREDRELAAGDLDVRRLRADPQALADPRERVRVGLLDREVVEHRDRFGPDAHDVVDVHRDAVDPDRLQPVGLLGDDDLRADAVRRHRDAEVLGDAQDARVMPARHHGGRRPVDLDAPQHPDEGVDAAVRLGGVDAGGGVRVAHRRHCVRRLRGSIGTRDGDALRFRYAHVRHDGETATGRCESRIEPLDDGRLRLHETWAWESHDGSGTSVLDEILQWPATARRAPGATRPPRARGGRRRTARASGRARRRG